MQNDTEKLPILEEVDFQDKKIRTLAIIEKYQFFNKRKAQDMTDCGIYLKFGLYENVYTAEHKTKLEEMYTCHDRFCPFCNWRRARKLGLQSYQVLNAIQQDLNVRYISVTFTVKNCLVGDLSATIKQMNSAFDRMTKREIFKNSILGFVRALEYPPQKDDNEKIHPHFHCLFIVPAHYFDTKHNLYIKQEEWVTIWQDALRVSYAPSVHVKIIRSKDQKDPIAHAVAETIKYPLKDQELKDLDIKIFEELVFQMKRKRSIFYGGIFKAYRKKLVLDDVEDGDLIYDSLEDQEIWKRIASILYDFKMGEFGLNYYERKV